MKKLTNEQFVDKAKKVHGNKYSYDKCFYEHSLKKVIIECDLHGPFEIKPSNHINNHQGCWHCGNESTGRLQKKSIQTFISQVKSKLGHENYDFSKIKEFKNNRDIVDVVCNIHGPYRRSPRDILRSKYFGCRSCKLEGDRHDTTTFVQRSTKAHGGRYLYNDTSYSKSHEKVQITCPKHGPFEITAYIHVAGGGHCPGCNPQHSSGQVEIFNFLVSNGIEDAQMAFRDFQNIGEIDIYSASRKTGIEFDGLYWHSDIFKEKTYHLNKTRNAATEGVRLIHVFEDEWILKKDICKSMILNAFGMSSTKIHARKCLIKDVDSKSASIFLNQNHIQGRCPSKFRLGLFRDDELVSLMTFGPRRICLGSKSKKGEYELLRFCNLKGHNVAGSASRLFKHFVENNRPAKITSYCDLRWGTGRVYEIMGFKKIKESDPNYFYTRGARRFGRFAFRKNVLVSEGYDKKKTEKQIMLERGYSRIYDCGCLKFEWTNK